MPKISPISYKKLAKIIELKGYKLKREKGSHLIYIKEGISRPVVIPRHNRIPVLLLKIILD